AVQAADLGSGRGGEPDVGGRRLERSGGIQAESLETMSAAADIAFLFDVDDTLFDNDRFSADLDDWLVRHFGEAGRALYRGHYETLRDQLGYADYLGAAQRFRVECGDEVGAQGLGAFLLDYPFAEHLYPH